MTSRRRKSKPADPRSPANVVANCPRQDDHSKELIELFNRLQLDDMSTGKAVGKLKKLYEDSEREVFFENLVFMIQIPLVNGTSKERPNKYDEKILQVVSSFAAASLDDETGDMNESTVELPWILRKVFDWLLDHHGVQCSAARLRICMMINWLLKNLGLHAEIDEILYQKIHDNMMERIQDKVAEIRAQAVTALQRLQDPADPDCPIIRAYLHHLKVDPSALVRRTVIKCIGASKTTLKPILQRIRDVDDQVRKAAYKFIADKVTIKVLSIGEREEILRQGLTDRSQSVQKVVEKDLVPTWLRICNGNIVELLHAIDIGNSDGKTATEICKATFSGVPYSQLLDSFKYLDPNTKLVPLKKLTPETVTYWKNLISFMRNECEKEDDAVRADEHLDKLLPELTQFCSYVLDYVLNYMGKVPDQDDELDEEEIEAYEVAGVFVAKNLIEMTSYFDLGDEVGRQNLCRLCKDLLANRLLPVLFIEPLMTIFNKVQTKAEARIQEIAEIISELRDPLYTTQAQELLQQPFPQQQQQLETVEEEDDRMDITMEEMTEKEREEELKRVQAEAKRNEENLRKKRVLLAKLRLKMNVLKDEMDTAVLDQEFVLAQEKKIEFDRVSDEAKDLLTEIEQATAVQLTPQEPVKKRQASVRPNTPPPAAPSQSQSQVQTQTQKDDPEIILKSLVILAELLKSRDIESLNPTLQTLLDEFIIPHVRDLNFTLREAAVKALGCACLKSIKMAKRSLMVVLSMAHLDVPVVRCRALRVVVDLLMWHGLAAFISETQATDEDASDSDDAFSTFSQDTNVQIGNLTQADLNSQGGDSVVAVLCQLLDDSDLEIRTLVAEGLCKLTMCGAITAPKLFSRLILMWCNPINEANTKLKTILGMFFPLYASLSRANQNTIEESFMSTMKTLMDAPETSPLAMVNMDDIGLFYLQLTRPEQLQESCRDMNDMSNVHDTLAFAISNFIISTPDCFYVKSFVKFLLNLQISSTNFNQLRELKDLYNQMVACLTDKLVLKTLEKYGSRLDMFISLDPEDREEPEEVEPEAVAELQRRDSVGSARGGISILNSQIEPSSPMNATKKRTLFSQTQNSLLDVSVASPAFAVRRPSKHRFLPLPENSEDQLDLSPLKTESSTQRESDSVPPSPSVDVMRNRVRGRISESSDSEVEFRPPSKQSRRDQPDDDSSDEEVILSGLLKRNQQTKKQSEMEKEGEGHRASEIEDKAEDESSGQSRVPDEAATASPIFPQKRKAITSSETLDSDLDDVEDTSDSDNVFVTPTRRSTRSKTSGPEEGSSSKTKSLRSKQGSNTKRLSSSSSSSATQVIEKPVEPEKENLPSSSKSIRQRGSKLTEKAPDLTGIEGVDEEEEEEDMFFTPKEALVSPTPRRQRKDVSVEKEKRKSASRSHEKVGDKENSNSLMVGKNKPVPVKTSVVEDEQIRRRSSRNSLEGPKGDVKAAGKRSSSQGGPKEGAAAEINEKSRSQASGSSKPRRKLIDDSSQEIQELTRKSSQNQSSPEATAEAATLSNGRPRRKLVEEDDSEFDKRNATRNPAEQQSSAAETVSSVETEKPKNSRPQRKLIENISQEVIAILESPARRSTRHSTSQTPKASLARRSQDSSNDEVTSSTPRHERLIATKDSSDLLKTERIKRTLVDKTKSTSEPAITRRRSNLDQIDADAVMNLTPSRRTRRTLADSNEPSGVPSPSKRKKKN